MKDHWSPWDTGTHVDMLNAVWGGLRGDRRPDGGSLPQRMGVQGEGKMPVEDFGISGKETEEFFTPGLEDMPRHPPSFLLDAAPLAGFLNQVKK